MQTEKELYVANENMPRRDRRKIAKVQGDKFVRGVQDNFARDERGKVITKFRQANLEFTRKSRKGVEYKYTKAVIVKLK